MRRFLYGLGVALALSLTACGPQTFIIQQYDGPVRDTETIAILRINGSDSVRVLSLDGEYADPRMEQDTRLHIELLPGRHTLRVASALHPHVGSRSLSFLAEAGRVYRVVLDQSMSMPSSAPLGVDAQVFEVDRGSDGLLRAVTAEVRPGPGDLLRTKPERPAPAPSLPPEPAPILAPPPPDPTSPTLPSPSTTLPPAPPPTATPSAQPAPAPIPPARVPPMP